MFKSICKTVTGFILLCGVLQTAAASVLFTGAGTWDATAQTSSISAPGARWAFSFLLPNVTGNPTSTIGAFSYTLNGIAVGGAPATIEFFNGIDSGMFDIDFRNGDIASFYGPTVWTATSFLLGRYVVDSGVAGGLPVGSGTITLQAVPEPGTWAMLGLGVVLLGAASRRRTAGLPTATVA